MARKDVLLPIYISPTASDSAPLSISLAADFVTVPTNVLYQDVVCYQVNITTSDSIGVFYVQVSEDYNKNTQAGNWVDMGQAGIANAANDTIVCEIDPGGRAFIRMRYDATTPGTGTCSILLTAKQLGG